MADTLALFVDALDAGHLGLAGCVLRRAWGLHERWPLDVAPDLRGSALCALADAERALVACRTAAYHDDAGRVVDVEGWHAPARSAA